MGCGSGYPAQVYVYDGVNTTLACETAALHGLRWVDPYSHMLLVIPSLIHAAVTWRGDVT
jgi:hypothetical protein